MREGVTIGRLAKAAGVNVETIRYYQRRGLKSLIDKSRRAARGPCPIIEALSSDA